MKREYDAPCRRCKKSVRYRGDCHYTAPEPHTLDDGTPCREKPVLFERVSLTLMPYPPLAPMLFGTESIKDAK